MLAPSIAVLPALLSLADGTRAPLAEGSPLAADSAAMTALGKYVAEDDGQYKWELVRTSDVQGAKIYDIRLTSQKWRTDGELSHPIWTHWLTIGVPAKLESATPILFIGGGRRRDQPRDTPSPEVLTLVRAAGAVVCVVDNIPNQPMKLAGDDAERVEDGLLARTWNLAMEKDDARWIGRFPMVKAVKRAMDAADEFLAKQDLSHAALNGATLDHGLKTDGYFVTGASKRGWTTWLIAAVDPRVKAIAPVVIDVLNMRAHTPHHWASYGFWAPALKDYVEAGIAGKFGSPELAMVIAHEDPAAYMKFLEKTPKFIVTASGDEFFPADSFRHYERLLQGEWRLRTVPNAGHSLKGASAPFEILAFYKSIIADAPRPTLEWRLTPALNASTLSATTNTKPERVLLWQAHNPKARDFRFTEIGAAWTSTDLTAAEPNGLTYSWTSPAGLQQGYHAFFMEFTFPPAKPFGPSMAFTTRVFITPDTLPFADKKPS